MCTISSLDLVLSGELLIVILLPSLSPAPLALPAPTVFTPALISAEAFTTVLIRLLSFKEACNALV